MNLDKIFVTIFSLVGIASTYWFFLMKNEKVVEVSDEVNITVDGGYQPEVISVPQGKITKITFLRIDPTECLSEVVLPEFKIKRELPLNQKVTVEVNPKEKGEFEFSCAMNMYHGKIVVR